MQKVIQFSHKSFWSGKPDLTKLNEKIGELNQDGWKIISVTPNAGSWGRLYSYTLLIEQSDKVKF